MAQLGARFLGMEEARGSNPLSSTILRFKVKQELNRLKSLNIIIDDNIEDGMKPVQEAKIVI